MKKLFTVLAIAALLCLPQIGWSGFGDTNYYGDTNNYTTNEGGQGGTGVGIGVGVGIGQGGSATIERGAVQNHNTNTNLNSNYNRNENTNVNLNSNKQGQVQGQKQGQGQAQSMTNSGNQTVNVGESPVRVEGARMSVGGTYIDPGTGRQAPGTPDPINPQFVRPNFPATPRGFIPASRLPKEMTLEEARYLAKDGKAEVMLSSPTKWEMSEIKESKTGVPAKHFVTGYSESNCAAAWAAALEKAMLAGAERFELVSQGITSTPSAFFIGLGGAYTGSQLSGDRLQTGQTAGGSGLIGYSKAWQGTVFFYTLAIYR